MDCGGEPRDGWSFAVSWSLLGIAVLMAVLVWMSLRGGGA